MTPDNPQRFPQASFVKARLLREPIYSEDGDDWMTVRAQQEEIRHFFRQIGQELVVDEAEGYAFLRQLEPEGDERVPRLVQRRPLSYAATLLLVCLREEFLRFDATPGDSTRLVMTQDELRSLISGFFPDTPNQVRDAGKLDRTIKMLVELGYLRALNTTDQDVYEVMRIVKARVAAEELEAIKERMLQYAESHS